MQHPLPHGPVGHAPPPARPSTPVSPLSERARQMTAHGTHGGGTARFHPMPVIGHPPAFYERHAAQADAASDRHAKAGHKVGQHVTAALDPVMSWAEKHKRFCHCLKNYCVAPTEADEALASYYHKLADLVRRHAGHEALTTGRHHHQEYMKRLKAGETKDQIADDAEVFFFNLLGHSQCPDWCSREAWSQLTEWRDYWV